MPMGDGRQGLTVQDMIAARLFGGGQDQKRTLAPGMRDPFRDLASLDSIADLGNFAANPLGLELGFSNPGISGIAGLIARELAKAARGGILSGINQSRLGGAINDAGRPLGSSGFGSGGGRGPGGGGFGGRGRQGRSGAGGGFGGAGPGGM